MRKGLSFLAALLLLVSVLTGCGSDKNQSNADQNQTPSTDNAGTNGTGGSNDSNGSTGSAADGNMAGDTQNAVDNAIGDVQNGLENAGDALDDTIDGVPYDQMLDNAKTRDTDGDLTDNENSVSRGSALR